MSSTLRLAAVMSTTKKAAQLALVDVCVLLGEELGATVELLLPQSPSALAHLLGSGEAELGWVSPTLLLMAPQLAKTVPLLSAVRGGRAFFHSVVFAVAGTVKRIEDMKNMRAAWVAPTSAAGYLVPCLALSRRGIDLSRTLSGERFYGTHGAVAQAVVQGHADIGATYAHYASGDAGGALKNAGFQHVLKPEEATILTVAGPIPADMIVTHPALEEPKRRAVVDAMLRLSERDDAAEVLQQAMNAEGFQRVSEQALDELRELVATSFVLKR